MISFAASSDEEGERVDAVLARRAGVTRTLAQRSLRSGEVTVEGRVVRPSHKLAVGESVSGAIATPEIGPPEAEDIPVAIRYSDQRLLVVSKPPGLVTHPARGHLSGTLVNALLNLGEPLAGAGSIRPGIVHRLDKDTSGLLLVAKDDNTQAFLVDALRRRLIERRYLALVRGRLRAASGTIEAPVGRHPTRRWAMAVTAQGRPSVTHYTVVGRSETSSLLDLKLDTGRTHQIRVHLAHLGHPVLGDRPYGGVADLSRDLGLDRPFLHAWRLEFPDPGGGPRLAVVDPIPPDLRAALERAGIAPPAINS
ncbi:MAG: RluA family pseudouridine synthase [Actinomycetota bacterium]